MPYFAYRGRDTRGGLVEGVMESPDSGAVAAALAGNGITPVEIGPSTAPRAQSAADGTWQLRKPKVTATDLLLLSRQMHALLKAGVPILRALGGLQESTSNPAFKQALQGVRENLESGRDLSASLQRQGNAFSPFYVSMIYVGETTGRLE